MKTDRDVKSGKSATLWWWGDQFVLRCKLQTYGPRFQRVKQIDEAVRRWSVVAPHDEEVKLGLMKMADPR